MKFISNLLLTYGVVVLHGNHQTRPHFANSNYTQYQIPNTQDSTKRLHMMMRKKLRLRERNPTKRMIKHSLLMIPPHSLYKKYEISLAIGHVRKNCLASSLIIVQKKHAPLEICWCFNALAKSNPPSITSQQQKQFRTKGKTIMHSYTRKHYATIVYNKDCAICVSSSIFNHLMVYIHYCCAQLESIYYHQITNLSIVPPSLSCCQKQLPLITHENHINI